MTSYVKKLDISLIITFTLNEKSLLQIWSESFRDSSQ